MKKVLFMAIASIASLSFTVNASEVVTITTGSEGGGYEQLGYNIGSKVKDQGKGKIEIEVINSNGSKENIERFDDDEADIAIVQKDALGLFPPSKPYNMKTAHTEVVYFFANKANGITDLEDIEGSKEYVLVIPEGAGAEITLRNFVKEDKGYTRNLETVVWADDTYDAFDIASEPTHEGKKVAGVLVVSKPGKFSRELVEDFGDKLVIAELTDGDFNDATVAGDKLYRNCEIDNRMLGGFKKATFFDAETICMEAAVIYRTDFDNKLVTKAVKRGVTKGVK